jgi:TetR/AcrR family transcriptional regulator, transcriptional repressor for nem operon
MGRPRGFDEQAVTRAAVTLFAGRAYDGVSVDDLVSTLGVHRNSLYKTYGSKRGLYLTALRWYLRHEIEPLLVRVAAAPDRAQALSVALTAGHAGTGLDLLLLAAVERAPVDAEVATLVTQTMTALDQALLGPTGAPAAPDSPADPTATLLGLRLRARAGVPVNTHHPTDNLPGET